MKSLPILLIAVCVAITRVAAQSPEDARARELLSKMTLEEKIDLLSGTGFATRTVPRLGIPALNMADGPLGVRWGRSTAFPAGIAMAASWNPELIRRVGWAIGREVKGKGRHMLLGPCVNICRVPQGGRNFESFGEDPFLASRMAVAYISGVQDNRVIACVKHFACNNQETERGSIDVQVDLRTLKEIYLPAVGDGRLQQSQRSALLGEPGPADRHPAQGVGLPGFRRFGLGGDSQHCCCDHCGTGSRDAYR
jgi:beta-glucosidase